MPDSDDDFLKSILNVKMEMDKDIAEQPQVDLFMPNSIQHYDHDLNPVLELASAQEFAPLVAYILDSPLNATAADNSYKNWHTTDNHKPYIWLIALEILKFGADKIYQAGEEGLVAGPDFPTYRQVICKLAEAMRLPASPNDSVAQLEYAILNSIMKLMWLDKSEEELNTVIKAAGMALDENSCLSAPISDELLLAAWREGWFFGDENRRRLFLVYTGIFARLPRMRIVRGRDGEFPWTTESTGPEFNVVAPCVAHVALLRLKYGKHKE